MMNFSMMYFFIGFLLGTLGLLIAYLAYQWLKKDVIPFMRAYKGWNKKQQEREVKLTEAAKKYIKEHQDDILTSEMMYPDIKMPLTRVCPTTDTEKQPDSVYPTADTDKKVDDAYWRGFDTAMAIALAAAYLYTIFNPGAL